MNGQTSPMSITPDRDRHESNSWGADASPSQSGYESQKDLARSIDQWVRDELPQADINGMIDNWRDKEHESKRATGPQTLEERIAKWTSLRPAVIENLLREGETLNLISETKVGKSWLAYDLALAKATGSDWLEKYCMKGEPVLYIDNELHEETTTFRFIEVAKARSIGREGFGNSLKVDNFRGRLTDVGGLGSYFTQFKRDEFKLVIIDAGYRALPKGTDENSNRDITEFYDLLDSYAMRLNSAFVIVHHSTKGSQGTKRVTDVGAGAGAQSRAVDAHVVLRQHQESDVFVLEAALRSWPKIQPFCLRWKWPLWTPDFDLDPADLRTDRPQRRKAGTNGTGIPEASAWSAERFVAEFITVEPKSKPLILEAAKKNGLTKRQFDELFSLAKAKEMIHEWPHRLFAGVPPLPPDEVASATVPQQSAVAETEVAPKLQLVLSALQANPGASDKTIANISGVSRSYAQKVRRGQASKFSESPSMQLATTTAP